ncbi:MAG TPA: IclR family transcriptional regulator [Arsenicitalea sp.]|nr:IclR family transcriptional regulator [Arsenicitalea sp.]
MTDGENEVPDTAPGEARGGIQSVDAAVEVLKALSGFSGPVTLSDLARRAQMPPSKVHRYLASFVNAGLVVQAGRTGRYDLGPEAARLGLAALARNDVVNRVADKLEDLAAETGLTALLSVWGTHGATVVRWERTRSLTVTSLGLGSTLPLLTSASGQLFLTYLPRRLTAEMLDQELAQLQAAHLEMSGVPGTLDDVEALVARIKLSGLASTDGQFIPGLRAVAAPVTNWQDEIEAAVTLIGSGDEILESGNAIRQVLSAFARRMSVTRPGS